MSIAEFAEFAISNGNLLLAFNDCEMKHTSTCKKCLEIRARGIKRNPQYLTFKERNDLDFCDNRTLVQLQKREFNIIEIKP